MRQRELLTAIADLEPVHIDGTFERHSSLRWEELKASAAGGRWGARGAYEVFYLGRPRRSVVVEAYRHLVDDELDDDPSSRGRRVGAEDHHLPRRRAQRP